MKGDLKKMKEGWKKGEMKEEEDAAIFDQDFHGTTEAKMGKV